MPTNDFLEYAAAVGANVQTQGGYAADAQRTNGQQTGIADSKNFNKMGRQANAITSALAQLVVNTLTVDMLDNGDQADKITKLTNMIEALAWINAALSGTPTAPTVAGTSDSSTKIATTAFVQAVAALLAPLASPTFTGTPAAPTAAPGTNTTQLATTAFIQAAIAAIGTQFTKNYGTGQQAFTFGSTVGPFTHGLGSNPKFVQAFLICTTADAGYLVGDVLQAPTYGSYSGERRGVEVQYLAGGTQFQLNIGADAIISVGGALTAADWKILAVAYA